MDAVGEAEIVLHPCLTLRRRCAPVGEIGAPERRLAERLVSAMRQAGGIGVAAPQIGEGVRAFAVSERLLGGFGSPEPLVMFDPELSHPSADETDMAEGCLSIPGRRFLVRRPREIRISWLSAAHGCRVSAVASGLLARCIQHEADHLDGILILDRGAELEEAMSPKPA